MLTNDHKYRKKLAPSHEVGVVNSSLRPLVSIHMDVSPDFLLILSGHYKKFHNLYVMAQIWWAASWFGVIFTTEILTLKHCPMRSHQKDLWHYSLIVRFCCGLGSCTCCCLLMRSDVTLHGSSSIRTANSSCCTGAWCNASTTASFQVLFLYYDVNLQQLIWIIPTTNMLK